MRGRKSIDWPIRPILGFWGAKFTKNGDSLPRTPMNHRAKLDAASFILAREIRNRTHIHPNEEHTVPIGMRG